MMESLEAMRSRDSPTQSRCCAAAGRQGRRRPLAVDEDDSQRSMRRACRPRALSALKAFHELIVEPGRDGAAANPCRS